MSDFYITQLRRLLNTKSRWQLHNAFFATCLAEGYIYVEFVVGELMSSSFPREIRFFVPSPTGVPYTTVASSEMCCRPDQLAGYKSASEPTLERIGKEGVYHFVRPLHEVRKCVRKGDGMPAPVHQYISRISAKFGIAKLYQKLVGSFNFKLRWKPSCL